MFYLLNVHFFLQEFIPSKLNSTINNILAWKLEMKKSFWASSADFTIIIFFFIFINVQSTLMKASSTETL